jgi:uncharacterized protein YqgV (UPF0045/DUF77 family)
MKISVEISMYPLDADYNEKVMNFINNLYSFNNVEIESNHMSTLLWGEYDDVMECLNSSMKDSFEELQSSMVLKISNGCKVD